MGGFYSQSSIIQSLGSHFINKRNKVFKAADDLKKSLATSAATTQNRGELD